MTPEGRGGPVARDQTVAVPADVEDEGISDEQRVAITLSVADGFKFGCGLILAGVAFYFVLIILVAAALLLATILNLPLPFGGTGR